MLKYSQIKIILYDYIMRNNIVKEDNMIKKMNKNDILRLLKSPVSDVTVYTVTDSTNTRAREMMLEGKKAPFLVASEEQTGGRGRHGNSFFSPDSGLYYTLVIQPENLDLAIQKTTLAAAVSLYEAILETTGIACGIKWVNDLYLDGRKIAGILCEAPRSKNNEIMGIIIGIGINIAAKEFPEELKDKAGSLNRPDLDRSLLTAVLTDRLMHWTAKLDSPELIEAYRSHSFLIGKDVSFVQNGTEISGTVTDINDEGNLIVEADRTYILSSGEVSLKSWKA